jgi:hypothetical protein
VHSRLAPGKCVLNRERVQDETERKQPPNDMRDASVAHDPALPNYDISRASGRLIGERRELMAQMLSDPAIIGPATPSFQSAHENEGDQHDANPGKEQEIQPISTFSWHRGPPISLDEDHDGDAVAIKTTDAVKNTGGAVTKYWGRGNHVEPYGFDPPALSAIALKFP